MLRKALNPKGPVGWAIVTAVGVLVLAIVLGMGLFDRLDAGQKVIEAAAPAFSDANAVGARAGIDAISVAVDTADPIVTEKGGGATEVPKLVGFVSEQTGLSQAEVVAALQKNFPHTLALLQAVPLASVSSELPALVQLLSSTLKITPDEVAATLAKDFPHLNQAVGALPKVTDGWDAVPGVSSLTRFDGSPVKTVPDIRDYFSADVIPVVERNSTRFQHLDTWVPRTDGLPWLLIGVGILVVLWGAWFLRRSLIGKIRLGESLFGWFMVTGVGLIVIGVVVFMRLAPALDGGQKMVTDLRPVFDAQRVEGHTPAISMVSTVVDLLDPITTDKGGAAADTAKLVGLVSEQTGLSPEQVVGALQKAVPHTAALLTALPLSSVSEEIPKLVSFLSGALNVTDADVLAALKQNTPRLAQSIASLPTLTAAWDALPGAPGFARFDGTPITNVTGVRDYFGGDVVPMVSAQAANFDELDTSPPLSFFPPLLLAIGIIATILGAFMFMRHDQPELAASQGKDTLRHAGT